MAPLDIKSWLLSQRVAVYALPGRAVLNLVPGPDGFVCTFLTFLGWNTLDDYGRIEEAGARPSPDVAAASNTAILSESRHLILVPGSRLLIKNVTDGSTIMESVDRVPSYMKQDGRKLYIVNDAGTMMSLYDVTEQAVRALL